jgi:hypothetical protein
LNLEIYRIGSIRTLSLTDVKLSHAEFNEEGTVAVILNEGNNLYWLVKFSVTSNSYPTFITES